MDEYYSADVYFSGSSDSEDADLVYELDDEEWQDWNSEELLDLWMSIVEYHENWYLPLNRTFNQFCEFVNKRTRSDRSIFLDNNNGPKKNSFLFTAPPPEIQAIKNHPLIRGTSTTTAVNNSDWNYFFSLSYK